MNASLNKKLGNVKWGDYKMGELFQRVKTNKLPYKADELPNQPLGEYTLPCLTSSFNNQGLNYYAPREGATILQNVISIPSNSDVYRAYYQPNDFTVLSDAYAIRWIFDDRELSSRQYLFMVMCINKVTDLPVYSYKNKLGGWNVVKNKHIQLPQKRGEIDFDFMESFIAELEAERVAELSAYLTVSGLDNYELSEQELKALAELKNVTWGKYKMGDLFEKVKTKKLPYKAKELPTEATGKYTLPCLTSSFKNQGLNYFAPVQGATVLKSVITIPQNSDVYRAYYQSSDFTVLSDAYAIDWKFDKRTLSREQYLFMVMCINKVTDLPIYSYKNKLGGWNVVKDKYILLPQVNGEIDFNYMEDFISAMQKLAIKDVVSFTDRKIAWTKEVIAK